MDTFSSFNAMLQVLSRRMRAEVGPRIPAETDSVGRLKHIGKQAVQKLGNMETARWNFDDFPLQTRQILTGNHRSLAVSRV